MNTNGWHAQVVGPTASFTWDITIYRETNSASDRYEVLESNGDGSYSVAGVAEGVRVTPTLQLNPGQFEALRLALAPPPDKGELARLEQALKVERDRVDSVLNRMVQR